MSCTNCTCDTVSAEEYNLVCEQNQEKRKERNRLYSALKLIVAGHEWSGHDCREAAQAALEAK